MPAPVPPADPALPDALRFRVGPAMILRMAGLMLLVAGCGLTLVLGVPEAGPVMPVLSLLAGLCGLVLPMLLVPAATRLELRREGWVQVALFRAHPTAWTAVDGFTAERRPGGWVIGFRRLDTGVPGALTANWHGIAPVDLAALMGHFRARRLAELGEAAAVPAPSPLPDRLVLRGGWTRGLVGMAVALAIIALAVAPGASTSDADPEAALLGAAVVAAAVIIPMLWPLTRRLELRPDRFVVQSAVRLRALDWAHARGFTAVPRRRGWVIAYERLPGAGEPPGPAELPGDWHGIDAPSLAAMMTRFRARRLAALGQAEADPGDGPPVSP